MTGSRYITDIDEIKNITPEDREKMKKVIEKYEFKISDYYLSLINWDDPEDPIKRLVIPDMLELDDWGHMDPSNESKYTIIPGLQHKYTSTALMLVSNVCASICRYCFRKRIFISKDKEKIDHIDKALEYIREHKEINNILLTGGDPLMLSTEKIAGIILRLREMEHIKIVRIGTKVPAFNPDRIIEDEKLIGMVEKYSEENRKIYFIVHFNHINELTAKAVKAVNMLMKAGAAVVNQTPMIRGVNDHPEKLGALFNKLSFIGVQPYYVFQCRPTLANKDFAVPIEEGYRIFEEARWLGSGLAKRARFVMSHETGKIEIAGMSKDKIYFKYHRAEKEHDSSKFVVLKRNAQAYWYDDYEEPIEEYSLK
ncbi:MAG: KamA family radical SAM protein [Candidatus Goldiibacteriota bacterium]